MEQEEMSFWMVEALKDNVARIWMAGGKGRHDRDSVPSGARELGSSGALLRTGKRRPEPEPELEPEPEGAKSSRLTFAAVGKSIKISVTSKLQWYEESALLRQKQRQRQGANNGNTGTKQGACHHFWPSPCALLLLVLVS